MTVEEMIRKYEIEPVTYGKDKGKILVRNQPKDTNERATFMAAVPEIKKYFSDKQAKKAAERARRDTNVVAIPGLKEIEELRNALARWHYKFERSFEGESACGGMGVGPKPKGDEKALLEQYPQAAAYLKVRAESESENYELSSIGKKALNRFEDTPENWKEIIADMDQDIKEFTDRHFWD